MYFDAAILLFTGFLNLLLAAVIVIRDPKGKVNRIFGLFALAITLWMSFNFWADESTSDNLLFTKLTFAAAAVVAWSIYLLSNTFVERPAAETRRLQPQLQLLLLFAVVGMSFTPLVVESISRADEGINLNVGSGYYIYILYVLQILIAVIINFISSYRTSDKLVRDQIRLLLTGILLYAFLAIMSNLLLPVLVNNWSSSRYGPIFSLIFVVFTAFAIVRHRMFDIRSYVVRALAYFMTVLLLSIIYIAPAVYILGVGILQFEFKPLRFLLGVVFATIIALYFNNLRVWFDRTTSRIFLRDAYESATALGELNRTLVSTIDLNTLLNSSSRLIEQTFKAEYCVFALNKTANERERLIGAKLKKMASAEFERLNMITLQAGLNVLVTDRLDGNQKAAKTLLAKNSTAVLIKLSSSLDADSSAIGYIMMGYKRSGNGYDAKDEATLEAMADVLVIAIQNALRFEEIQNFNITLQQRVENATRQLRKTNAKLEALDETKDDFISMASHQLRTPLTAVKGYLSMVLDGDAGSITAVQKKMLNQAFMSSQRMVFLIADLLNVSRLKTGKFVIERSPLSLAGLIHEEIGQLRETAASRNVELAFDKPKDFPLLMLDETKTRQVVMNFIDNAIHYTPQGGHIAVKLIDKPQSVELRVTDDGIGVPKPEQHHLFTKFYRAANARRERPDGTGLGLFMAKKVIVAQGGAVIFESREGKGSTFGFTLPKDTLRDRNATSVKVTD
ncbi:MAG TPA: ATP-binding protein [Candidatus Saccharimonadales bacterium]|jgi:signal transduction histidine kinase